MRRVIAVCVMTLWACGALHATDTAWWRAVNPDKFTYGLYHFDSETLTEDAAAVATSAEAGPGAGFVAEGKFGGAARFDGKGFIKFVPSKPYPSDGIALQAWIKLDRYPAKEGCIVFKPAIVDNSAAYDPKVDRAQGFALIVDSQGRLVLSVTNRFYGWTIRTESDTNVVPLGEWVQVTGLSQGARRLYVNGKLVKEQDVQWGQGLMGGEEEATLIYIGNNDRGEAGIAGLVDEVRVTYGLFKLWEQEDMSWTQATAGKPIPKGQPYLLPGHEPTLHFGFDGTTDPTAGTAPNLQVVAKEPGYVQGIRGQAIRGPVDVKADHLVDMREGSYECWFTPFGVNNYTDFGWGFLSLDPTVFYIWNTGVVRGNCIALALYYYSPGGLVMIGDDSNTELYEGRWYHFLATWKEEVVRLYLDGKRVGEAKTAPMYGDSPRPSKSLHVEGTAAVDELFFYPQALEPEEVANCYNRYRYPTQVAAVKPMATTITAWYYPSANQLRYALAEKMPAAPVKRVKLALWSPAGKLMAKREEPFSTAVTLWSIPDLPNGTYTLHTTATLVNGKTQEGQKFVFPRKHFPWEGNKLGITDTVYPPFTPISVKGKQVGVVQRSYTMNNFGLWDSVVSQGRELLAAPMRLRYETAQGEGAWGTGSGRFTTTKGNLAVYSAQSSAGPLAISAASAIEQDGCMKVTMDLAPGKTPAEISKLWVDIPLQDAQMPLMHVVTDGLRQNYAGNTPTGEGRVWDGSKAVHYNRWQNSFASYVWLGAEERGLAWFGENDRGWYTQKGESKEPIQALHREGDQLVLRVYLINTPTTLKAKTTVVFGLQASPTKPMPENWRAELPDIPGGLPVHPWGGLNCSYQTPYRDHWEVVDKMLETRAGKPLDKEWFDAFVKQYDPPKVYGNTDWLYSIGYFTAVIARQGTTKPMSVYQEEMAASAVRDEIRTFQDEWSQDHRSTSREWPDESIYRRGFEVNPGASTDFSRSYQDFGVYVADQWMRRGVSPYWDNTYPKVSWNIYRSAAYVTEEGKLQPAVLIWNQREYQKRVWNQLAYWRTQRPEPIEWVLHMTNTLMLPIHGWGSVDLDHELGNDKPFTPDWLRTETIGRQIGNHPLSLYPVRGNDNKITKALPQEQQDRIEWGMRVVHEIQHAGALEKYLTEFGYADGRAQVHNYWADEKSAASVDNEQVKWLALARPGEKAALMVLASWSAEDAVAQVKPANEGLGFDAAGARWVDAESGEALAQANGALTVALKGPYGVRIIKTAP